MVKETLVGMNVEFGHQILSLLDAAKFPVPVALWIRRGEEERWRLLLATPLYDRLGPLEAYGEVIRILWPSDQDWVSSPLQIQSTRTPLVRELRRIFRKAADVAGMRLGGQMIGGVWVADAYVYRIQ
jgi:hypothetical protein